MTSPSSEREIRAKARAEWPIRRFELGAEPEESLRSSTTAVERLAMMWELAEQAWALSGRPFPDYPRHQIPGRIVRARR